MAAIFMELLRDCLWRDLGWGENASAYRMICAGLLAVLLPAFTVLLVRRAKHHRQMGNDARLVATVVYMGFYYLLVLFAVPQYIRYDLLPYLRGL